MLTITEAAISAFTASLTEREYSPATVAKYAHDARLLLAYAPEGIADKAKLVGFRAHLEQRGYSGASVNSILGTDNLFLAFPGSDWRLKYVRVQRKTFLPAEKELSQAEYACALDADALRARPARERAARRHGRKPQNRRGAYPKQGQAADDPSAGRAVPQARRLLPQARHRQRQRVRHPDRQAA